MNTLKTLILAVGMFIFVGVSSAFAYWDIDKMNVYIDNTNWVVNGHCSGTTLNKKERLIITNFHCVIDEHKSGVIADEQYVTRNHYQDYDIVSTENFATKVIAGDAVKDLAIVQIINTSVVLPDELVFPPSNWELKRGQKV